MDPQTGLAAFRLGMLVTFPAVVLLLFLRPGTAEFSITVFTVLMGATFLGVVALLARWGRR